MPVERVDVLTCEAAARLWHLAVLRWAQEHDCPWGEMTCSAAAGGGHLDVLRWAREHDCAWNPEVRMIWAGGNRDVLALIQQLGGSDDLLIRDVLSGTAMRSQMLPHSKHATTRLPTPHVQMHSMKVPPPSPSPSIHRASRCVSFSQTLSSPNYTAAYLRLTAAQCFL